MRSIGFNIGLNTTGVDGGYLALNTPTGLLLDAVQPESAGLVIDFRNNKVLNRRVGNPSYYGDIAGSALSLTIGNKRVLQADGSFSAFSSDLQVYYDRFGRPLGALIERASANLFTTYSSAIENAAWTKGLITPTDEDVDGYTRIDETAGTGDHRFFRSVSLTSGQRYIQSCEAKPDEAPIIRFTCSLADGAANMIDVEFNLSTGVVTAISAAANMLYGMEARPNGAYRCWASGVPSSTNVTNFQYRILRTTTQTSYAGTAGEGLWVKHCQLETSAVLAGPSSYMESVTSQGTRVADVFEIATSAFDFNVDEGTLIVAARLDTAEDSSIGNFFLSLSDGTNDERLSVLNVTSGVRTQITTGGVAQADVTVGSEPPSTETVMAGASYAANSLRTRYDGATGTEDTSLTLPTVDRLHVGIRGDESANTSLNGVVSYVAYWPYQMTTDQMRDAMDAFRDFIIVADGNSITVGFGGATSWLTLLENDLNDLGYSVRAENVAISSQDWDDMLSSKADVEAALPAKVHSGQVALLIGWDGRNQMYNNGDTPAEAVAAAEAYFNGVSVPTRMKKVVMTILQDNAGNPNYTDQDQIDYNALLTSGYTGYADYLIDVATNAELQDPDDTTYFNADTIHPTTAGEQIIADDGRTLAVSLLP